MTGGGNWGFEDGWKEAGKVYELLHMWEPPTIQQAILLLQTGNPYFFRLLQTGNPYSFDREFITPKSISQSQSQSHVTTDGQSVGLSWCRAPSGAHDQIFILFESYSPVFMGRPL
jgi:hypothetical protein